MKKRAKKITKKVSEFMRFCRRCYSTKSHRRVKVKEGDIIFLCTGCYPQLKKYRS